MRILLTGASSFTGSWFARELCLAGHHVVATFRGSANSYEGTRKSRVDALKDRVDPIWNVEFGDERFLSVASAQDFDLFLHHGAEMADYRSWDFDALAATAKNTRSLRAFLSLMAKRGCRKLILTGTVFEPYEGVGDPDHRAFNPYGLSKHLTYEIVRMESERLGLSLGKFLIPNPFGPREEMRFTSYMVKEWAAGRRPKVTTPLYIRDNIHVSLLALAYRRYCETLPEGIHSRAGPSGYVESQGAFAQRFSREMSQRLSCPCPVDEAVQTDFSEPRVRTNTEPAAPRHPEWPESAAWDQLAEYYRGVYLA